MKPIKKIAAGIDFSEHSREVLSRGLHLAQTWEAGLAAIHVLEELPYRGATTNAALVDIMGRLEEDAARELDRLVEEVVRDQVKTETEVLLGVPYRDFLLWAWHNAADLLVVGNESRSGLKSLVLGRNAEAVIQKSLVPVWIERKGVEAEEGKILLPTDLSENSLAGVLLGLEWARKTGARVYLAHVVDVPIVPPFSLIDTREYSKNMEELGKKDFERFLENLPLDGIASESHFLMGHPLEEIRNLMRAKKIGLAVLSTHGTTGLASRSMGSFCIKMVRDFPCHTLVVRPQRLDFSWLKESFYQEK